MDNLINMIDVSKILFGLYVLAVGATIIRVLAREYLSPVKRLAWIMVLAIVPIAGFVLYFLFGEAKLNRISNNKHKEIAKRINKLDAALMGHNDNLKGNVDSAYQAPFRFAQTINGFGLSLGNKAELMPDAEIARERLIQDIDAAKETIEVMYYIWLGDKTGTKTAEALTRAAKRGVKCRVMADALGSRKFINSKPWKEMKDAGVMVTPALPYINIIRTVLLSRFDLRNHRKITVIDGEITHCGSQNCADAEFLPKKKYGPWVDIMIRFEGSVVSQNRLLFAEDWMFHKDEADNLQSFVKPLAHRKTGIPAQAWGSGPTDRPGATQQLFVTLINSAQENVIITTPYFVPDETVLAALYSAAYRGMSVTMVLPAKNDSWIVRAVSQSYYRELLEAGVKILEYEKGLLHSKTITIDDKLCMIGSTNIDLRSFDLNYENNIIFYDAKLTKDVRQRQDDYMADSQQVTIERVKKWNIFKRIGQNIIATMGPVL